MSIEHESDCCTHSNHQDSNLPESNEEHCVLKQLPFTTVKQISFVNSSAKKIKSHKNITCKQDFKPFLRTDYTVSHIDPPEDNYQFVKFKFYYSIDCLVNISRGPPANIFS